METEEGTVNPATNLSVKSLDTFGAASMKHAISREQKSSNYEGLLFTDTRSLPAYPTVDFASHERFTELQ